jgi:hypothetical protein
MMVVVTVESPRGRITLAAPDDVPVEQLLPALAEACRCEGEASRWSLRARREAPLAPERTLEQAGLYQGAILELRAEQPPSRRAGGPHLASWAEVGHYLSQRAAAGVWLGATRWLSRQPPSADARGGRRGSGEPVGGRGHRRVGPQRPGGERDGGQ